MAKFKSTADCRIKNGRKHVGWEMTEESMIMYDSPEAAEHKTVTGWVSGDGRFYGKDEHMARWGGCTHMQCECDRGIHEKGYTCCDKCRAEKDRARFLAMPEKVWDGSAPLVIYGDDTYFFDRDSLFDYCDDNGIAPQDLRLVICEPNYPYEVEPDEYYCDELPEDQHVDDIIPEIAAAFDALNKIIRENKKPLSWSAGEYRAVVPHIFYKEGY